MTETDDRSLGVELEAVKSELATLREERRVERASRTGPRPRRASRDPKLRLVLIAPALLAWLALGTVCLASPASGTRCPLGARVASVPGSDVSSQQPLARFGSPLFDSS